MKITVIISTYNNPASLRKSLWGFCCQTDLDFEIIVADDGSGEETRQLVESFLDGPWRGGLRHLWHEDQGFRKTRILNQAVLAARGDFVVFTDGDCIPRDDFVAAHRRYARSNWYVTGGSHIDIPESVHQDFCRDDIQQQRVFEPDWLTEAGFPADRYRNRLTRSPLWAGVLNRLTPRSGAFLGCNTSVLKQDVLDVNGLDETIRYGSDDKEMGIRLTNHGIRSRRLKYSLICLHLGHERAWMDPETVARNKQHIRNLRRDRIVRTRHGISEWQSQDQPKSRCA